MTYQRQRMGKKAGEKFYKALVNKKKLPEVKKVERKKNPDYAKLTQEEFEKKYPDKPTLNL